MTAVRRQHFLNDVPFGGDKGWRGNAIKVTFDDFSNYRFDINSITLQGDIMDMVREHLDGGLNGGGGYFEAMKYRYEVGESPNMFVFNGITDWTADSTEYGCDEVQVKIIEEQGFDWLTENAGGFSIASLYNEGIITDSDFVKMSYVINYVPDALQLLFLGFGVFTLVKELIQVGREIADSISEIINSVTPSVGFGITWDIGDVIWVVLKVVARLAYAIAIVIALVQLIKLIFEQLLPKRRDHLGMKISTIFEAICEKMGYQFQSTLIYDTPVKDWAIIPRKFKKGGEDPNETGYPDPNSPIYTADKFIAVMMEMFNAKPTIDGNIFHFERRDKLIKPPAFNLRPYYNDQENRRMGETKNYQEIQSQYNISFVFDIQDQNTLDVTDGFHFEQQLRNTGTTNKALNLLKNATEIDLPFSLGLRKDKYTGFEKVALAFAKVADAITGVLGNGTNFASRIENRIGSCLMSSHFTSVMKLVSLQGNKLTPNQRTVVSSGYLWDACHFINSAVPINGIHNQWVIYKKVPVQMDDIKLLSLLISNALNYGVEIARVDQVDWPPDSDIGFIDFRINKLYMTSFSVEYTRT
jgi:hypothetical protein